ncbi:hypothetical protein H9P43_002884 [Blastocladiella emersonii ATCC 22665]|nr:hypothetical protein H9P43_002884 [Blastocladiella emersonii ATCC 22665]
MSSTSPPPSYSWLIPLKAAEPGASAVLNNLPMFILVHGSAVVNGLTSIIGCIAVLAHASSLPLPDFLAKRTGGLFQAYNAATGRTRRRDLSARFAIYLAAADVIWHTSHLIDHALLLIHGVFPSKSVAAGLGTNLFLWYGYTNLLHLALSAYSYLKIVRNKAIKFGKGDWMLHFGAFGSIAFLTIVIYVLDGFGLFAYWCLGNSESLMGLLLAPMAFMVAASNALCTTLGHRAIENKLTEAERASSSAVGTASAKSVTGSSSFHTTRSVLQSTVYTEGTIERTSSTVSQLKMASLSMLRKASVTPAKPAKPQQQDSAGSASGNGGTSSGSGATSGTSSTTSTTSTNAGASAANNSAASRSAVATQCLRNLVRTASFIYVPLAVGSFAATVFCFLGVVEPFTCFVVATSTNCAGWVNAYAYFKNELLKTSLRKGGEDSTASSRRGTVT